MISRSVPLVADHESRVTIVQEGACSASRSLRRSAGSVWTVVKRRGVAVVVGAGEALDRAGDAAAFSATTSIDCSVKTTSWLVDVGLARHGTVQLDLPHGLQELLVCLGI